MFSQATFPSQPLSPQELDEYLVRGWFRTGQNLFTCAYIHLNNEVYRVFWLRVALSELAYHKPFQKLLKQNSKFSIVIQQASITPEKEALYSTYKNGITFDPSPSLQSLLYHELELDLFNTLEIDIYDGERLIAVGFFDVGKSSAAGISCFYDPAYKKYSLGKYLIYQKMMYCQGQHMDYFYLGYFAPGCRAFDYKLDIAKDSLEYLDLYSQQWCKINTCDIANGSIEENRQKLMDVQRQLTCVNIENRLFSYTYFQINQIKEFNGYDLFDYLMFVYCFSFEGEVVKPIIVYDIRDQYYHILNCISVGRPEVLKEQKEEYSAHVLKIAGVIYSSRNVKELVEMMVSTLKTN